MNIEKLRELYKLKNIIRYNTKRRIKDESVAEHSFYVALISLLLCKRYRLDDKIIANTIIKALLHDMPEIELNDITHDVKEKLNLAPILKTYEDNYYKKHFPEYIELMTTNNDLISAIVNTADAMSVQQYSDNELLMGNRDTDMFDIMNESEQRVIDNITKLEAKLKEIYDN